MGLKEEIDGWKPPNRVLPIHVFGKDLYTRRMSGTELDAYQTSKEVIEFKMSGRGRRRNVDMDARLNLNNIRARLGVLVLSDEHGNRLLEDKDAEWLGTKDAQELEKIYTQGCRQNGLDEEAVEGAEKNSETTRNGVSGSASPLPSE